MTSLMNLVFGLMSTILLMCSVIEADVGSISPQATYYHYPTPKGIQLNPQPIQRQQYSSQQQQQQRYTTQQRQAAAPQHYQQYSAQHQNIVARQFSAPALEHAAFTMALTNQGYNAIGSSSSGRSNTLPLPVTSSSSSASSVVSAASPASSASNSFNIKLPVPIGITPINIAPLPLQAGTPYSEVQTGLTSYGTPYPQRR